MASFYYKIVVRQPDWESSSTLWDKFEDPRDAEDFVKEAAITYPEGTIFWIARYFVGSRGGPTTFKSFVVNQYGEAVKRKRKWVPDRAVPFEWLKELPEEPEDPTSLVEGYETSSEEEKFKIRYLIKKLGGDTNEAEVYKQQMRQGYIRGSR